MVPKLYNKWPKKIKNLKGKSFAKNVKEMLLSQSFYIVQEFLDCDLENLSKTKPIDKDFVIN